jgi:hypothetical protein
MPSCSWLAANSACLLFNWTATNVTPAFAIAKRISEA